MDAAGSSEPHRVWQPEPVFRGSWGKLKTDEASVTFDDDSRQVVEGLKVEES